MFFETYRKGALLLKDCAAADVRSRMVREHADILIKDGTILAVGEFDPGAVDAEVISVGNRTVTPGLIDAHVHLCLTGLPGCHLELDTLSPQESEGILRENLQKNLRRGITTVRDLGCRWEMLALMGRLSAEDTVFPSVQASGPVLTIPDGHGIFFGEAVSSASAPQMIDRLIQSGAEIIKIIGTGGNLSPKTDCHGTQYSDHEFSGIMDAVRAAGLSAACHTHAAAAVEQCMRFGVRSIEHGSYMEDAQARRLADMPDCYWVPTVCPGRIINGLSEAAADRVTRRRRNIRIVVKHGGRLAAGTDAGIGGVEHGCLAYELDEFMDAGMSAMEALRSATFVPAEMMRKEGRIGVIEAGAAADLLIFDKSLTDGGFSFHEPSVIIKGGRVLSNFR